MKRAKKKRVEVVPPSERVVKNAIRRVAERIVNKRLWFAVYRALADLGAVQNGDYAAQALHLSHRGRGFLKLCTRFDEYYSIALEVKEYLE